MKIEAGILFLIFVGLLYLDLAGGYQFNTLYDDIEVTMVDNSTYRGSVREFPENDIPFWLNPGPRVLGHYVFIRTSTNLHFSSILQARNILPGHNRRLDRPTHAHIRVYLDPSSRTHFRADSFQPYVPSGPQHFINKPNFPLNSYIYISLPQGQIYSSPLQPAVPQPAAVQPAVA